MLFVLGTIHGRRSTLADSVDESVPSKSRSNEGIASHAAKLSAGERSGKQVGSIRDDQALEDGVDY